MEIVKYSSGEHRQYLPEHQKPAYSEGDIERFRPVAEEALQELREIIDFHDDIELVLAITDEEELSENTSEDFYFTGFSFDEGMRGYPANAVFLRVSDQVDNWRERMKDMLIHELGHQVFYQSSVDWKDDQYHSIMFEGHAENLANIAAEENDRDYTPVWRKDPSIDIDKEMLFEDLEKPRTFEDEVDHNMFIAEGSRWTEAEGYTIAYQVVNYLIENAEVEIDDMLGTPSEEWREMVGTAIEELY